MDHIRYINIRTGIGGFWVKIAIFVLFVLSNNSQMKQKKPPPNIEDPESLITMLEY